MAARVESLAGPDGIFVNQHQRYLWLCWNLQGTHRNTERIESKDTEGEVVCFVFLSDDKALQLSNKEIYCPYTRIDKDS